MVVATLVVKSVNAAVASIIACDAAGLAASITPITVLGGKLVTELRVIGEIPMSPVTTLPAPVDPVIAAYARIA